MPTIFFTDIDDTLIQTKRKCPGGQELQVAAVDKNNQPASFMTHQQKEVLSLFSDSIIVPVTGRNISALERVLMDFTNFKVIDHGVIILDQNNNIDESWLSWLENQYQDWQHILNQYNLDINHYIESKNLQLRCRVISDFDISCYISIKGESADLIQLKPIIDSFLAINQQARRHINGTNMALLPPYASKQQAVNFLIDYFSRLYTGTDCLFIGAGDSLSDLGFMSRCHFSLIPNNSQIAREKQL